MSYLRSQFLVDLAVGIGTVKRLLQKGKQHGNDDDRLQRLAEDDEEDGDGEDVLGHVVRGTAGQRPG